MKKELSTLDLVIEEAVVPRRIGITFKDSPVAKNVPVEILQASHLKETSPTKNNTWKIVQNFIKPTFSNLILFGCLVGLFVLYCCSCVIHALSFLGRKKGSSTAVS